MDVVGSEYVAEYKRVTSSVFNFHFSSDCDEDYKIEDSPSRIMRLCDHIILCIICIFHYVRIIVQGAHNF